MEKKSGIHLRQICIVAHKLEPVLEQLKRVFGFRPCYTDPSVGGFGLRNVLLPIGTDFLEIVAPIRENTAASRYLKRRGGDGGYMVICQVRRQKEQEAVRSNAERIGVRVAWESKTGEFNCMQFHPGDMGGAFFEVDWDFNEDLLGSWHPAGGFGWTDDNHVGNVRKIRGVRIQSLKPEKLGSHWSNVSGIPLCTQGGQISLPFLNADLQFVNVNDNRGDGLSEIDFEVTRSNEIFKRADKEKLLAQDKKICIGGIRFNIFERTTA